MQNKFSRLFVEQKHLEKTEHSQATKQEIKDRLDIISGRKKPYQDSDWKTSFLIALGLAIAAYILTTH